MLTNPVLLIEPVHMMPGETFLPFEDVRLSELLKSGTFRHDRAVSIPPVSNDNRTDIDAVSGAAKMLLRSYWMHISEGVRTGLLRQTNAVLNSDDWDEEDCNASLDSYKTMLRSIVALQPNERPVLGVGDNGNFLAAWYLAASKVVIEFLPRDRMKWMIALSGEQEVDRAAGQTNVSQICKIMEAHGGRALVDGEE